MSRNGVPARLLWIVDREAIENGSIPRAIGGGVRWVHLRDGTIEPRTWRQQLSAPEEVRVVVNGGPPWALAVGWGAHLKAVQHALPRAQRVAWSLLGRSVHDAAETSIALRDRPDYLVAGPVFPTTSKPGHEGLGLAGLRRIVAAAKGCPVLAIGGIQPCHVAAIGRAGAHGLAVRSGITAAAEPASAAADYLNALPVDPG